MAEFDPFANQGGPVAWDPEHAKDAKKQAEELSRRLAADDEDESPPNYPGDGETPSGDALIDSDAEVDDDIVDRSNHRASKGDTDS